MPKYLFTSQNSSTQQRERPKVKNPQLVALSYQGNELRVEKLEVEEN